jgi:hypothetical protein
MPWTLKGAAGRVPELLAIAFPQTLSHWTRPRGTTSLVVSEGKSRREATRLLKRYLAHHLYRLLQNQEPLMA